ncbi:low affinity immunoglobulin gamma Fc region receptor II-like isoform 3-T3 [Cyanocitta cristata]
MARKVVLLLWAQTLGLAGAQTTQLLVEPPWTPPVLWDWVTLTCQGSGTTGATTWYKDGQRWWLQGLDRVVVTESGTYQCDRPGTGLSPPVSILNAILVLQVPARALLEGDTVTLRCRSWQDKPVTWVSFYREEKQLQRSHERTELSLSPLRLQDSGRYRCRGWVETKVSQGWRESESVPVTVRGEHPTAATLTPPTPQHPHGPFTAGSVSRSPCRISFPEHNPLLVLEGPPEPTEGFPLNLSNPQPPAAPSPPPAPLLPGWAVGGGPAGVPTAPAARRGGLPLGELQLRGALRAGAVRKSSARLRVTVRSECGDGRGEPRQPPRVPHPACGPRSPP